jgi:Dna[CI] antecedent, DciA
VGSTPATPASGPHNQRLATALHNSEPLNSLLQRLHASQARYAAVAPLLPPALRPHVRAGALDDAAWALLADNAAAAAKLRQLAPELQASLDAAGYGTPPLRIKVSPPR